MVLSFLALLQVVILFSDAKIKFDIVLVPPRVPARQVKTYEWFGH